MTNAPTAIGPTRRVAACPWAIVTAAANPGAKYREDQPWIVVYLTRGLMETLLRLAREREPDSTTIPLAVTPAGELPIPDGVSGDEGAGDDLSEDTPIFTHFYLPRDGDSVTAVFGVDLGTPVGQTEGVFVSHPLGELSVSKRDDLREVVFVAVPPWDEESLAAFDRRGRRQELSILDVDPPEETTML